MMHKKKSQAAGPGNSNNTLASKSHYNDSPASSIALIDRLENVKSTGKDAWRARCPHHQGKSQSLSIKYVDGKVLLTCFVGCETLDIVQSVGLTLADLFDKTPHSKPVARQYRIHKDARRTLEAIQVAVTILMIGINRTLDGKLTVEELDEIDRAYRIISRALESTGIKAKELEDISRRVRYG